MILTYTSILFTSQLDLKLGVLDIENPTFLKDFKINVS